MTFTLTEVAETYGFTTAEEIEKEKGYLTGKLEKLNRVDDLRDFVGYLDKRNQRNFVRMLDKKLEWLRGL